MTTFESSVLKAFLFFFSQTVFYPILPLDEIGNGHHGEKKNQNNNRKSHFISPLSTLHFLQNELTTSSHTQLYYVRHHTQQGGARLSSGSSERGWSRALFGCNDLVGGEGGGGGVVLWGGVGR